MDNSWAPKCLSKSYNHRTAQVGKDLCRSLIQPPAHQRRRSAIRWEEVAQRGWLLKISKDGDRTTPLGLLHCWTLLTVKKLFLKASLNLFFSTVSCPHTMHHRARLHLLGNFLVGAGRLLFASYKAISSAGQTSPATSASPHRALAPGCIDGLSSTCCTLSFFLALRFQNWIQYSSFTWVPWERE